MAQQENTTPQSAKNKKISRRSFVKLSVGTGVSASLNAIGMKSLFTPSTVEAAPRLGRETDTLPIEISGNYRRMDQKNTIFCRFGWDPGIMPLGQEFGGKFHGMIPPTGQPGWTELDGALSLAAWSVDHHAAANSEFGLPNQGLYAWEGMRNPRKTEFKTPGEAATVVKKAAHFLGASLVGIADYDPRWVYENFYNPFTRESTPGRLPFEVGSVVVMAIEMDYEAFKTAPSLIASAAAGNIYSNMAVTAHKVATFIRQLGYRAIPCGNDTAMSIPLAAQAGLGELGRNGLLITEKYGPRVRLCKVFTDLPIQADRPVTFGVVDFCEVCRKCADQCPGKAISQEQQPGFTIKNISNNPGVKKWCIDAEKCFAFWAKNGGDCGSCIASCPYNKIDEWHHGVARLGTVMPGAKSVLRSMDELFGYGKTYDEKAITYFWRK